MRAEVRDLAEGVHTGVRAARAVNHDSFLRDPTKNLGERALNRGFSGLELPAVIVRAVVGYGEFEIAHAEVTRNAQETVRTKWLPGFRATLPSRQRGQSSGS